jgi:hypothetical protein
MTRLSSVERMLPILSLFTVVLQLCGTSTPALGAAANQTGQPSQKQAAKPQAAAESSIVVGTIGTYEITKKELYERLMEELYPYDSETYDQQKQPPDAQTVLMKMLAEKAMIMEARKEGLLKNELITSTVKRFRERRLIMLLAQRYVERYRGKITATPAEITQKMHADKKLTEARAKALVEQTKAGKILDAYYMQIYTKAHVKKLDQNYAEAIEIYQRLLHRPKEPRKVSWIQNSQIRNELTPREKNIVLAQYAGGKVTLEDWLETYCDIVPPRRSPINTPGAVEGLLERALRVPLLVWEATSLGFDKDPDLLKQVRDYEDRRLLGEAQAAKRKEVTEPTADEIIAYFRKNQEAFGSSPNLKIDLIWCHDLAAAKKAKAELDGGKDFETVKQHYSLEKKSKPFNTYPGGEGLFWKELWAGEPGQVLGPLKGFYRQGIKWRLVKILEKTPGKAKEYSPAMESQIKNKMMSERGTDLIARYGRELLKKYPHQVYPERIKDVNPLNIP